MGKGLIQAVGIAGVRTGIISVLQAAGATVLRWSLILIKPADIGIQ